MKPQIPKSFPRPRLRGRGPGEGVFELQYPWSFLVPSLFLIELLTASASAALQYDSHDEAASPTVGEPRLIEQLFLPGSQLEARPLTDDKQPIVLRFVNTFPQGTLGYRYDLIYSGYEPGPFDLRNYLVRVDGSSTDDLPPIPVQIRSLLSPGQIEPNALPETAIPRLGGYRWWLTIAIIFWCWALAAILLVGRHRHARRDSRDKSLSLAELLRPRIQAAMNNKLDSRQYAELERMLIAMWQRRLHLDEFEPSVVISKIREHPESGPLMCSLERWMHDPKSDRSVDLTALLEPLSRLSADDLDWVAVAEPGTNFAKPGAEAGAT